MALAPERIAFSLLEVGGGGGGMQPGGRMYMHRCS